MIRRASLGTSNRVRKDQYWNFETRHLENCVHLLLRNTLMFNCQKSTPYCIKHLTYWHCKFHFSISSSLVLPSFHLFTMHLYVTTPGFELCVLQSSRDASDLKYSFVDIDNSGNLYPCMWELMFFFFKKKIQKSCDVNWILCKEFG